MRSLSVVVVCSAFIGCTCVDPSVLMDGGTFPDSGAIDRDAGPIDSGTDDAGQVDAGVVDAGVVDAGVVDAGVVDAGVVDAGSMDAGADDAGLVDSGLGDAGVADAGTPDGGTPDSGTPDASVATVITIDFGPASAAFPPSVNKLGFNSFWNSASYGNDFDDWVMRRSSRHRAPMIAGLLETKPLTNIQGYVDDYEEWNGSITAAQLDATRSCLWEPGYTLPLFFRNDAGVVLARTPTDPDLAGLRTAARNYGLLNFLQLAGTPGTVIDSMSRNNGLYTLVGQPTTGGNWYPLPAAVDYPSLARAFGSMPDALGYATPTIYSYWQEPSHTLDESVSARVSVDRYSELFWQIAAEVKVQCRFGRCPVAGAQLNSNDGDSPAVDGGGRYGWFTDAVRAARLANPGRDIPLDYFTVQNYAAQWNDAILPNTRLALGTDFNWTPVLMNEWDYCVNTRPDGGDALTCAGLNRDVKRTDGPQASQLLHWLKDSLEYPDVSHVLLREKVLRNEQSDGGTFYPWVQIPVLALSSMSEFRRPARPRLGNVPVMASGDDEQLTVVMWNEGTTPRTLALSLTSLPPSLMGQTLMVKNISKAIRDVRCPEPLDVLDVNDQPSCWGDATAPIVLTTADTRTADFVLAPGDVVIVRAGTPPSTASSPFTGYVRDERLVKRDGTTAAPKGTGHYDPRTGRLTVGVQNTGVAVSRVTMVNLPNTLTVSSRLAAQGPVSTGAVAGLRVDYLDAVHAPAKTVFFRDSRWTTSLTSWANFEWAPVPGAMEVNVNFCPGACVNGSSTGFTIDLAANAPLGWAGDVVLGAVLSGAGTDAIYQFDVR